MSQRITGTFGEDEKEKMQKLPLNKLAFWFLIADKWGTTWQIPVGSLLLIVFLCLASAAVAIRRPIRQISRMAIVDTIKLQQ